MAKHEPLLDYGQSGMTVQEAMVHASTSLPSGSTIPRFIIWNGQRIQTSDKIDVPKKGVVRATFITTESAVEQGFDIKVDDGWLLLANGEKLPLLRTWNDAKYEEVVEYHFFSNTQLLWVWNVYKMRYRGRQVVEEKWTENAGFWVERQSDTRRVYHCSHGQAYPPNFESLVFEVTILPELPSSA